MDAGHANPVLFTSSSGREQGSCRTEIDVILAGALNTSTAAFRPYLIVTLVFIPAVAGTIIYWILDGFDDGANLTEGENE